MILPERNYSKEGRSIILRIWGIRNVITGYKPQDRAMRLENLVYNHLVYSGYDVKIGTLGTEEIDFVCKRNGEILYVQVSLELLNRKLLKDEFGNYWKN